METRPDPTIDATIARLAERQLGLVTTGQAEAAGLSRHAIDHRVRTGRWSRVHRGVLRIEGHPRSHRQSLAAACLAAGPGAAVSHRAAADLHGIRLPDPPPVEISVPRPTAIRRPGLVVHRSRDLDADQVVELDGLTVTSPLRLLVDLGQVVEWWLVDRALESLLVRKAVTVAQVRAGLEHHSRKGRNGCGPLRHVLDRRGLGDLRPEGVTEALFAQVCHDRDLPVPVHQHEVRLAGQRRRIDFAYPDLRIAIELDGYEYHVAPDQFEIDRARGNELVLAGWTVLRFTYLQLLHRPGWVVAQIDRARRAAGAG